MYIVEDQTFVQTRAILSALARELETQRASGDRQSVDLHDLVRRSTTDDLPPDGEADYLHSLAETLEKSFPISELFPRKRRARSS